MIILGISCYYHDSAAALVSDGRLLAASLEERFSRVKHDNSFPKNAIEFCLGFADISSSDLDYVVFYEKPFLKFERIYQSIFQFAPKSFWAFRDATISSFAGKLFIASTIAQFLGIDRKKVLFIPHHLSHAASAFLCSPFRESAILTIDGVGEYSTATIAFANEEKIEILEELRFPASLGLLYSSFTAFLGFQVNEGEYKVMGLSAYGKPKYVDKIYQLVDIKEDGSIELDLSYFSFHYHTSTSFTNKFVSLFGSPRLPHTKFDTRDEHSRRFADISASIQRVTEEIVVKMANYARKITGSKNLCYAGGVALNGLANFRITQANIFKNIYIQPAAGDGGGALGAALYVDYYFGKHSRFLMDHVYYGEEYDNEEIEKFIKREKLKAIKLPSNQALYDFVIDKLLNGQVVGWFQGRFEWGSRALGNRSILADPRNPNMKSILNKKIKFRESFRPFAPSVLFEEAHKFFELSISNPLDFMLYVVPVRIDKRLQVPAITHQDGTSRPQLVRKEISPLYYQLIKTFYKITGIPMLLNTSFNLSGEPIVSSPEDAYSTFMRSGLDVLVLGDYIIEKKLY